MSDWLKAMDWLSKAWSWCFEHSHVVITAVLLGGVFIAASVRRRRWPTEGEIVELIAYGWGVQSGASVLRYAGGVSVDDKLAWPLMVGGVVLTFLSGRALWRIVSDFMKPPVEPKRRRKPGAAEKDVGAGDDLKEAGAAGS